MTVEHRPSALLLLVMIFAACQAGVAPGALLQAPPPSIPTETGVGPRSAFALAAAQSLLGASADGKILGRIADLPPGRSPSGLALHPDGKRLFFALSENAPPPLGFGSDVYSVNVDGSGLRPVVKREGPNVFYASPVFDSKGDLYVHRREGDLSGANIAAFAEVKDVIERVDVMTGRRTTVIRDGADATVTPDGTRIVYMRYDRGQATDLWIAATDGSGARKFLRTDDWFAYLQSPRISPSGREVVWSSLTPTQPNLPGSTRRDPRAPAAAGGKLAHYNMPSDLFVAPLDGSQIRSIITTIDDVVPAWSPDGARIAFVAQASFWVISIEGKVLVESRNVGVTYADPVWLRN